MRLALGTQPEPAASTPNVPPADDDFGFILGVHLTSLVGTIVADGSVVFKTGSPDVHGRPLCQALNGDDSKVKIASVHSDSGCSFGPRSLMG
jgi:hypothetical protein